MDTASLKKFAQKARLDLIEKVASKLKLVLAEGSTARRENAAAIQNLEKAIEEFGKESIIERVAYIWFNRFCALRYMDVKEVTYTPVVSPAEGQVQPAILTEAKLGSFDSKTFSVQVQEEVSGLLNGRIPSKDPQAEAYRLLLVAACNHWHSAMPFLFQRINDYTELLMPSDLLSNDAVLAQMLEALTPENCESVEVIGWLYQFYIAEKKDQVFDDLKKNKKVSPENIPAATQLFTPHWIVRYLVQNSLGRLWMLNNPNSSLIEHMEYYIPSEKPETDFLKIDTPEQLKVCDPACGSGHMLTYAFDLLYEIYEEQGYSPSDIPEKILTHNLYGIELDERAGELAAFALSMKAREHYRRFFNKGVMPNICVLENIRFSEEELDEYLKEVGQDLFTQDLRETLLQFDEVSNFGSLIIPKAQNVADLLATLKSKDLYGHLFLADTHKKVLKTLEMAEYLSPKYHAVVANPPYMGGKGMNTRLSAWLKENYEPVKSDLFSAFIVRNLKMTLPKGQLGFMTPFVWMFISSYEKLRLILIEQKTITSLIQLEYSGFDGATVPICTFTLENSHKPELRGGYVRLSDFKGADQQGPRALEIIQAARLIGK